MAVTEERRHGLYSKFEEVIGTEHTSTVMELLPPVGWADVARRSDLDHLRSGLRKDIEFLQMKLERDMESMEHGLKLEMSQMAVRFSKDLRSVLVTSVTANATLTALIVSVAKLF